MVQKQNVQMRPTAVPMPPRPPQMMLVPQRPPMPPGPPEGKECYLSKNADSP